MTSTDILFGAPPQKGGENEQQDTSPLDSKDTKMAVGVTSLVLGVAFLLWGVFVSCCSDDAVPHFTSRRTNRRRSLRSADEIPVNVIYK
ncbi:hypothetical protein JZ751_010683 [Albula glossodonta]|uniref:Uncharacterized protein n=1 Tax=Albula glossodonta TaxID=121402 RepID=A0A8T2N0U0_9TELE|nr:hypothetical protein JZ751_010683 [Albula glossodonta]